MIIGKKYRISILTSRLIRLEYQKEGRFVDEPTQAVLSRDFPETEYKTDRSNGCLKVETEDLILSYDEKEFSPEGLSITLKGNQATWHYSVVYGNSDRNLLGTARTLDGADGRVELEGGIFGENGFAVLDDSESALLSPEGEWISRNREGMDLYFFGYGKDFSKALKDFHKLAGEVPMIPRYALGNWWSRYYRYTEESYNDMLDKMKEEKIPLSVAVIDMDWHLTQVDPKYGTGWTGYTWDEELFPDYKRFLKNLKDRNLAVTLNLHPADGIRAFEVQYEDMAEEMGIDAKDEKAIEFDFADKKFREAYFKCVMHPYEDDGVDFWWIDWQQGTKKGKSDIDPLFLLNHYHYEDRKRGENRPMIFSRYAGVGSHRYPLGFSGDTVASWKSLAFQPYFTSNASNIGYGWWSHDIGGHMLGDKNEERLIRWIQFGVFSPIMRLHSSCSEFFNKEPWNVSQPYRSIMGDFLRLRHKLLPYTYTMSYKAHKEGMPLVRPLYYGIPDCADAYNHGNEYYFGDNLLVGAVCEETNPSLRMAKTNMVIPKGRWYDIFNGRLYTEGKRNLYRTVDAIPVLLKAGGIIPLSEDLENGVENPKTLKFLIGSGDNGEFELYEDDGLTMGYLNHKSVVTRIHTSYDKKNQVTTVTIDAAKGDVSQIPKERNYEIELLGLDGENQKVKIVDASVQSQHVVKIPGMLKEVNDYKKEAFEILERAWMEIAQKEKIYALTQSSSSAEELKAVLENEDMDLYIKDAIREIL